MDAAACGAGFLPKPFSPGELREALDAILPRSVAAA